MGSWSGVLTRSTPAVFGSGSLADVFRVSYPHFCGCRCFDSSPHTVQDVPMNRLGVAVQQRARSSPHSMNDIKSVHLVREATRHPSSESTNLSVQSLSAGAADRNKSVT